MYYGKEFCGKAMVAWAHERGVQLRLIEPGKPKDADAALARAMTGAISATHETQRQVASGKVDTHSSARPGKSRCGTIDLGGEMVTPFPHLSRL